MAVKCPPTTQLLSLPVFSTFASKWGQSHPNMQLRTALLCLFPALDGHHFHFWKRRRSPRVCVSEKEQSRRSRPGLPGGRAYGFASPHSPNKYSWIRAPNIRIPRHPLGLIDAVKPGGSQSSQFLASGMAASRYWRELDRIKSRRLKLTTMISEWQKSETRVSV